MCYRVVCKECERFTWGGCGKHLTTLYSNIEKGKHCTCRPWPGVAIPSEPASSTITAAGANEHNLKDALDARKGSTPTHAMDQSSPTAT